MRQNIIFLALMLLPMLAHAANDATIVHFNEREEGMEPYRVRYIITNDMLRIDDDIDDSNFVLYDDKKRVIYSVNHDDSTILVIKHNDWSLPDFKHVRNISWKKLEGAPEINGNKVMNYWLSAGDKVCSEAQVVENLMIQEAAMLQRYKQTLSAEQINSLVATPEDMRSPCMLVDQVYNNGDEFSRGFPIQQWHINGLQRIMTKYQTGQVVAEKLFELPEKYQQYTMGDNLSFGERGETPSQH